ncbi:hypothetical protein ILUMI_21685 [Ignelater luminosus]|uniref:Secreted protein n=1 Tax=Ignelater luminosus TaxID=2038154 RepID=A0A8K0G3H4_IGNLU|nr:hypothetical protein ILUMI_21685 [Ignelater luminosus]
MGNILLILMVCLMHTAYVTSRIKTARLGVNCKENEEHSVDTGFERSCMIPVRPDNIPYPRKISNKCNCKDDYYRDVDGSCRLFRGCSWKGRRTSLLALLNVTLPRNN